MKFAYAFAAWRSATKLLWWTFVQSLSGAVIANAKASAQMAGLNPRTPRDCWRAGYALFRFDLTSDAWQGSGPTEPGHYSLPKYQCADWSVVPWHLVEFSEATHLNREEIRAVSLAYCEAHLKERQFS